MYEYEYMNQVDDLLHQVSERNQQELKKLPEILTECIRRDKLIHTFGTGHSHMIGIELFARAGGLGNVDAILDPDALTAFGAQRSCALEKLPGLADMIYDNYKCEAGDVMIISSNSGRNALPIEMAMRCQKEGVYVIAVTNLMQSKASESRHPSGRKLYEYADSILDNGVPFGDSLVEIQGMKTGPGSTISSIFLLNTIITETIRQCVEQNIPVPLFQSQNVDGFDNDRIYDKYDGRVKHF